MAKAETQFRKLGNDVLTTSLAALTDFVLCTGLEKLTVANRILEQYQTGYQLHKDYYKRFRDTVVHAHATKGSVGQLADLVEAVSSPNQQVNYQHMVRGYQRFWASCFQESHTTWMTPPRVKWETGHLIVTVNPELGFVRDGHLHLVKMYLKKDEPSAAQLNVILHLMQSTLWTKETKPVVAVVDVRRGRMFEATNYDRRFEPLLRGEALSLVGMCRMLELEGEEHLANSPERA